MVRLAGGRSEESMLAMRCCLGLALLTIGGCGPSVQEKLAPGVNVEVVGPFIGRQSECRDQALNLIAKGPFTRMENTDTGLRVFANERDWDEASRDVRISWVGTFYCGFMPSNGKFAVRVFGTYRTWAIGSMVDGNYSD
jgi:hypothetical protein